jgi:hypothetical protein
MTPSGDLYVNDNQLDQLVRIAPDGGRMAVLDDVDYPKWRWTRSGASTSPSRRSAG